jgi:ATP-dependent DNA ligase
LFIYINKDANLEQHVSDRVLHAHDRNEGPFWSDRFHEIKFDGYRLRLERNGDRVRPITKGGYDWSTGYTWILEASLKNRQKQFVIDGEAAAG